ncbi:MAG: hypothetical protein AAF945_16945 [Actinomycetota bacterium]
MSDPTPDPELTELASAYLDGAADATEIARVEADAELLAEVERLRIVRALVSTSTEEASLSIRESHLAAALDVFDRMSPAERSGEAIPAAGLDDAAAAAITTPTPLGARRSGSAPRPIGQWLLGTAAALLLVVGGLAVFRATQGADDDSDLAVESPEGAEEADDSADELAEIELPLNVDGDDAADGDDRALLETDDSDTDDSGDAEDDFAVSANAAEDEAMEAMDDEEAMDEEESADEGAMDEEEASDDGGVAAPESDAGDDGGDDGGVQPSPGPEIDLPILFDEIDLGDFGAQATYAEGLVPGDESTSTTSATTIDPVRASVLRCRDAFEFDFVAGPALLDVAALDGVVTDPSTDPDGGDDPDGRAPTSIDTIEVLVGVVDVEIVDGETVGDVIAVDIDCEIVTGTSLPSEAEFQARAQADSGN